MYTGTPEMIICDHCPTHATYIETSMPFLLQIGQERGKKGEREKEQRGKSDRKSN